MYHFLTTYLPFIGLSPLSSCIHRLLSSVLGSSNHSRNFRSMFLCHLRKKQSSLSSVVVVVVVVVFFFQQRGEDERESGRKGGHKNREKNNIKKKKQTIQGIDAKVSNLYSSKRGYL